MENARILYCHTCKKEFQSQDPNNFDCLQCGDDFCELIIPNIQNDDPRNFVPYGEQELQQLSQIPQHHQNPQISHITTILINSSVSQPQPIYGMFLNRILSQLFPQTIQQNYQDNHFNQILDFIMRNDTNQYGNPPASQDSIEKLQTIEFDLQKLPKEAINDCIVCKEVFNEKEKVIVMPCKHIFHNDCLIPWLKIHNTCPTCRFELPTSDQEQEQQGQSNNVN